MLLKMTMLLGKRISLHLKISLDVALKSGQWISKKLLSKSIRHRQEERSLAATTVDFIRPATYRWRTKQDMTAWGNDVWDSINLLMLVKCIVISGGSLPKKTTYWLHQYRQANTIIRYGW